MKEHEEGGANLLIIRSGAGLEAGGDARLQQPLQNVRLRHKGGCQRSTSWQVQARCALTRYPPQRIPAEVVPYGFEDLRGSGVMVKICR